MTKRRLVTVAVLSVLLLGLAPPECHWECNGYDQCVEVCHEEPECQSTLFQSLIFLYEDGSEARRVIQYCRDTTPWTVLACARVVDCTPEHPYPTCQAATEPLNEFTSCPMQ
jgi:hypothetical protein